MVLAHHLRFYAILYGLLKLTVQSMQSIPSSEAIAIKHNVCQFIKHFGRPAAAALAAYLSARLSRAIRRDNAAACADVEPVPLPPVQQR